MADVTVEPLTLITVILLGVTILVVGLTMVLNRAARSYVPIQFKLTWRRVFLSSTLFFSLARGLDSAREGRDPLDASVFLGAACIGVFITVLWWIFLGRKSPD
jgi:hypothetical protein